MPTRPAPPRLLLLQVEVDGPSTSTELHGLASGTEYLLAVFPVYEAGVGEGLRGLVTTGGWGSWLLWVLVLIRGGAPLPTCCVTEAESLDPPDPQCPLLSTSDAICAITTTRTVLLLFTCFWSPQAPAGPQRGACPEPFTAR